MGEVIFNKYRVIEVIGQTQHSIIYLAENIKLGSNWAIKVINKARSEEILLTEPHILKTLKHDGIPQIVDIEEDDENLYLIEEYVEGINLNNYKLNNQITEDQIIDWGIQLCEILNYLHTREPHPIIYRDMKPDNVVLRGDGKVKLIDFGIARAYKYSATTDTTLMGTNGYAPPELFGIGQSDERTDIFSLGVTLYYLITGRNLSHYPYQLNGFRDAYPNISGQLESILLKATELIPHKRFANGREMLQAFQLLLTKPIIEQRIFLNPSDKRFITVEGLFPRIGTTHFSIMLAHYFIKKEKRVALIELTEKESFFHIETRLEGVYSKKKSFEYHGISFYPKCGSHQIEGIYSGDFDVLICDCGLYSTQFNDLKINASSMFVLGGIAPWEQRLVEDFAKDHRQPFPYKLLINYRDVNSVEKFVEQMDGLAKCEIYPITFQSDMFKNSSEQDEFIGKLFGESSKKKRFGKRS